MRLAEFNKLLLATDEAGLNAFVQKYIFHGTPHVFHDREEDYFEFRNRIALRLGVSFHEVFVVGSGKLGFSFVKNRDSFDYGNDVDVAIVSDRLFEEFSIIIRDYQYMLNGGLVTHTAREEKQYRRFLQYFAKGWIRPDMAKNIMNKHKNVGDWDEYFLSISFGKSEVGDHKVAAGIFKSYDYLQRYHFEGLKNYAQGLRTR